MFQSTLCRLCRTSSLEFKCLLDDSGQLNGVYKIAVKYFDPMLLYPGNDRTCKVICMECWRHINDFYTYQQSVISSQAQLEYVQSFVNVVKLEEQFPTTSWSQQSTSFSIYDFIEPDRIATTPSPPPPSTSVSVFELVKISGNECPSKKIINSPVANENDKIISKWKRDLECVLCKLTFPTYSLLSKHFGQKHYGIKCRITCCGRNFFDSASIVDHIHQMHKDETDKSYHCKLCTIQFSQDEQLTAHVLQMHSENHLEKCTNKEHFKNDEDEKIQEEQEHLVDIIDEIFESFIASTDVEEYKPVNNAALNKNQINEQIPLQSNAKLSNVNKKNQEDWKTTKFHNNRSLFKEFRKETDDIITKALGELKCYVCGKTFKSLHLLRMHFKSKHKKKSVYITCCGRRLSMKRCILQHIREKHFGETSKHKEGSTQSFSTCNTKLIDDVSALSKNQSDDQTSNMQQSDVNQNELEKNDDTTIIKQNSYLETNMYNRFIKKHKKNLECPKCYLKVTNFHLLNKHFKNKHVSEYPYIMCCNLKLSSLNQIYDHLLLHTNTKVYHCTKCDRKFNTSLALKHHERLIHEKKSQYRHDKENTIKTDEIIAKAIGDLECIVCQKTFPTVHLLGLHFKLKHKNTQFHIYCCGQKFKWRWRILRHVREMHKETKKSPRKEAESTDSFLNEKLNSDDQHSDEEEQSDVSPNNTEVIPDKDAFIKKYKGDLECPLCNNLLFENFTLLSKHFKMEHPTEKAYAMCCNIRLISRSHIYWHVQLHANPETYQCSICTRNFTNNWNLKIHRQKVHNIKDKSKGVRLHARKMHSEETKHNSEIQSEETKQNREIQSEKTKQNREIQSEHTKENHKMNNEENNIYECPSCSGKFSKCNELEKHTCSLQKNNKEYKCEEEQSDVSPKNTEVIPDKDAFIKIYKGDLECPLCNNLLFENFTLLSKHFKMEHPTEKAYAMCCNIRLISRSHIYWHVQLHANPETYQCSICTRNFKKIWNLKIHRQKVHNIKDKSKGVRVNPKDDFIKKHKDKLECPICNELFDNFTFLSQHFRSEHPSEKPYIMCCNLRHLSRYHIYAHLMLHANPNSYRCSICERVFKTIWHLKSHEKNVHGNSISSSKLRKPPSKVRDKKLYRLESDKVIAKRMGHLKCFVCKKTFPTLHLINLHFKVKHKDIKFHLECCGRQLIERRQILLHARKMHSEETKHNSEIQSEETKQNREIQSDETKQNREIQSEHTKENHKMNNEENIIYECPSCSGKFSKCNELEKHTCSLQKNNKEYKCDRCPAIYRRKDFFKAHYRKNHEFISNQSFNNSGTDAIQQFCEENAQLIDIKHALSQSSSNFSENFSNHNNQQSEESSSDELEKKICRKRKKKEYKCDKCPAVYMREDFFRAHCRKNHEHSLSESICFSSSLEKCNSSTEALQQLSKENVKLIDLNYEFSQSSYASSSSPSRSFNNREQSDENELTEGDDIFQWSKDPTTNILKSPKKERESINDSIPENITYNQIQISALNIDVKEEVEEI